MVGVAGGLLFRKAGPGVGGGCWARGERTDRPSSKPVTPAGTLRPIDAQTGTDWRERGERECDSLSTLTRRSRVETAQFGCAGFGARRKLLIVGLPARRMVPLVRAPTLCPALLAGIVRPAKLRRFWGAASRPNHRLKTFRCWRANASTARRAGTSWGCFCCCCDLDGRRISPHRLTPRP